MNAFDRAAGVHQMRLVDPQGFDPPLGSAAFVLGADVPGFLDDLEIGDECRISQVVDLTGYQLVRWVARLRGPGDLPPWGEWQFRIEIDGSTVVATSVITGKTRDVVDLTAVVYALTGNHLLAFVLELV